MRWFQFDPASDVKQTDDRTIQAVAAHVSVRLTIETFGVEPRVMIERGVEQPRMQGWLANGAKLEPHVAVGIRADGASLRFRSRFEFDSRRDAQ
jgi:hypothetical protein